MTNWNRPANQIANGGFTSTASWTSFVAWGDPSLSWTIANNKITHDNLGGISVFWQSGSLVENTLYNVSASLTYSGGESITFLFGDIPTTYEPPSTGGVNFQTYWNTVDELGVGPTKFIVIASPDLVLSLTDVHIVPALANTWTAKSKSVGTSWAKKTKAVGTSYIKKIKASGTSFTKKAKASGTIWTKTPK